MSRFEFGLQFLDTTKMTNWGKPRDASFWIENASIDWNERQAPFHTVARLTLLPKSQLAAEASEAVYFDVTGNSTPGSAPLGSINRARWPAEVASRQARMRAETAQKADAPSDIAEQLRDLRSRIAGLHGGNRRRQPARVPKPSGGKSGSRSRARCATALSWWAGAWRPVRGRRCKCRLRCASS